MTRHGATTIRVGISACLLGEAVRFDGGHKRDPIIIDTLGRLFEWVPVCPEVELGLGVPRETLALEGSADAPRLVFRDTRVLMERFPLLPVEDEDRLRTRPRRDDFVQRVLSYRRSPPLGHDA